MKKSLITILGISFALMATGCEKKEEKKVVTYKYTTAEVYTKMCSKCHGDQGQGNPKKKGPAFNDQSIQELKLGITDYKNGGSGVNSSGSEHEVMEHNYQKIKEKGMDYDTDAMAQYIYDNFNINKK
ncbi:MAG: cytochrome c [Epsilonproteobacteria bacterium]|nr:cytochrome c [Campylobacterota bacterium]